MKHLHRMNQLIALCLCLLLIAGCATTLSPNPTLEQAQARIASLTDDPAINRLAAAELRQARDHLGEAERVWRDGGEAIDVSHLARLAMRQADIAVEATKARQSDQQVEQLRNQREQLGLQARAARAEQAASQERIIAERERAERAQAEARRVAETAERVRAQQAQREAEVQREQAEMARREAEELRMLAEQRAAELERQTERMREEAQRLQQQLADLEARATERGLVLTLGSDVLFDFDRADVKPGAERTITQIAAFLNEYEERQVLIEGFTDSTGSRDYNLVLSERRAQSVRNALISRDVDPARIRIIGYGPDHPVASNDSDAGRQLNRRVEVIISDDNEDVPERD